MTTGMSFDMPAVEKGRGSLNHQESIQKMADVLMYKRTAQLERKRLQETFMSHAAASVPKLWMRIMFGMNWITGNSRSYWKKKKKKKSWSL